MELLGFEGREARIQWKRSGRLKHAKQLFKRGITHDDIEWALLQHEAVLELGARAASDAVLRFEQADVHAGPF